MARVRISKQRALELIVEISENASLDRLKFTKKGKAKSDEVIDAIYRIAHAAASPTCGDGHPNWHAEAVAGWKQLCAPTPKDLA